MTGQMEVSLSFFFWVKSEKKCIAFVTPVNIYILLPKQGLKDEGEQQRNVESQQILVDYVGVFQLSQHLCDIRLSFLGSSVISQTEEPH